MCVLVPSNVPVVPILYGDVVHLFRILVKDLALKLCASSPYITLKSLKKGLGNLYNDCHVLMTTSYSLDFSCPP